MKNYSKDTQRKIAISQTKFKHSGKQQGLYQVLSSRAKSWRDCGVRAGGKAREHILGSPWLDKSFPTPCVAIPVGRYPSSRDMFQGASTAVPGTCKSASNKDKFKHFKQINLQLKNSYSDAYTKETYRIISISPRGWLNPQVQGRKGQTVIYCETQVQNNFRDKSSPWR